MDDKLSLPQIFWVKICARKHVRRYITFLFFFPLPPPPLEAIINLQWYFYKTAELIPTF